MTGLSRPTISAHIPYALAWMVANPGRQRRAAIQAGALEFAPWSEEQRALPPTSQEEGKFPSLLHQQVFYAIWRMRDNLGLIENAAYGVYVLTSAGRARAEEQDVEGGPRHVGRPFPPDRTPRRRESAPAVVFEYDPDERDRATDAHEVLVHQIRDAVIGAGLEPLLPNDDDPRFDVAFYARGGETLVVVEVKSLGDDHAVHQLRLGLGQVLHYAHQLRSEQIVVPALVVPVQPPAEWRGVCETAGVTLVVGDGLDVAVRALGLVDG